MRIGMEWLEVVLWQPEQSDECECLISKPFRQTAGPPVLKSSKTSAVHHVVFVSQFHGARKTGGTRGNPQKLPEQVSRVARREIWQLWSTQVNVAVEAC